MFQLFNLAISDAPEYNEERLVGRPVNAVIATSMQTDSGKEIFNNKDINLHLKNMFNVWVTILKTEKSQHVLNKDKGWLSEGSRERLTIPQYDDPTPDNPQKPLLSFTEAYACNIDDPYFGFKSWDDFFVRKHKNDKIRPLPADPKVDNSLITCACESHLYRIANEVKLKDDFWAKDKAYSLKDMFNGDLESANKFVGGSVFQTYLSPRDYHHWHSPVKGTVEKIVHVWGTYYSVYPDIVNDPAPNEQSVGLLPQVATRVLIYIKPDNENIGKLVCFIGIGMFEVSTCQVVVKENDKVNNGDELGMFHFGGSSHALVFTKEAKIDFRPEWGNKYIDPEKKKLVMVNSKIATVRK